MKIQRILSLVLALVLCVGMMTVTASAAGEIMYGIGFVNASSLRLRSEPDGNSGTLTYAPRNDCVVVIEKTGDSATRFLAQVRTAALSLLGNLNP